MKAMIFAAGLGTRLYPVTRHKPKALVEVGGRPMLGHVIERLKAVGVTEAVVNVHHMADMIRDYLSGNDDFGITIHISDETNALLDTGGGVLRARGWLDGTEPFIVHNADILTDADLNAMWQRHIGSGADVTLLVAERDSSRHLVFDNRTGRLCGWINNKTGETRPEGFDAAQSGVSHMAFGGVHVISPSVFLSLADYGMANTSFSITPYYVSMCDVLDIRGYTQTSPYMWFDIGKPATLAEARAAVGSHSRG